ncbi:TraR/DksA family transcriptional regulator [Alicyclobacillus acidoterrestris]|uniref:TraR/DksA C4-type zinc finger protein n=1 Tax=Alicyclobacillus suci TaxID=2816080 RepID=UPI001193B610|nr:TraR/DksA C4-type zinc finger protein [Alicyclobacillus suci]GEO25102.1 TraR/DksA family transcriptional regulator [Alicyclobacillus acidoterrestris]
MNYEQLRAELVATKNEIERRLEQDTESANLSESMQVELSELSLYDNHPADVGSELFLRGMAVGDRVRDEAHLADIEQALRAMDEGTYGQCRKCGRAISMERLAAVPTAMYCVECQRAEETQKKHHHRPVEEHMLYPGFGEVWHDREDQNAYDGEDAWQDVERHNERPTYDYGYEQVHLDDNQGIVDDMDAITNEQYEDQLPPSPTYRPHEF